jgi:hypothetical protein
MGNSSRFRRHTRVTRVVTNLLEVKTSRFKAIDRYVSLYPLFSYGNIRPAEEGMSPRAGPDQAAPAGEQFADGRAHRTVE